MKPEMDYSLYLVTDRALAGERDFEDLVGRAIRGGCTLVQLREKEASSGEFYERALRLKKVTDYFHVPLIIDDRIDIMLAVDAAGVHLGQSDLPAEAARQIIGPDKILGVSARTVEDAEKRKVMEQIIWGSVQFTRRQQRGMQRKCPGKSWKKSAARSASRW